MKTTLQISVLVGFVLVSIIGAFVEHLPRSYAAEEPRRVTVDMTIVMLDLDGKPLKDSFQATAEDPNCKKCDDLTLGGAVMHALAQVLRDDQAVTAQRPAWLALALRIQGKSDATLNSREQTLIIDRIEKVYALLPGSVAVTLRAPPLIDANWSPPELK
jgi:hypothetical protein